eukprot:751336-Hanusia_phi.AAC.1
MVVQQESLRARAICLSQPSSSFAFSDISLQAQRDLLVSCCCSQPSYAASFYESIGFGSAFPAF